MRRRHKLEVSTFPFLAVLLCAMGSLILLLLVMDRRAKIAARAKTNALQQALIAKIDDEAKRQADEAERLWETQKSKLHEMLRKEDESLRVRKEQLDIAFAQTERDIQSGKSKLVDLERRLADEQKRLLQDRDELVRFRQQLSASVKEKSESTSQEAIRLARELQQLERLWERMKQVRSQPRDVFSLVPFKGKRGEKRPPIYVECVRGGLAVHPRKTIMPVSDEFDVARFRREVEARSSALVKEKKNASALDKPHVLFLVRPDGIASYHAAQSALSGFQIDFGYELVDAHWVFDFDPNAQPTRVAWNEPPPLKIEPSIVTPGSRKGVGVSLSSPRLPGPPNGDGNEPYDGAEPGVADGPGAGKGSGPPGVQVGFQPSMPPTSVGPPPFGKPGLGNPTTGTLMGQPPGGVVGEGPPSFGKPGVAGGLSMGSSGPGMVSPKVGSGPPGGVGGDGSPATPKAEASGGAGLAQRSSVPALSPILGPPGSSGAPGVAIAPKASGPTIGAPRTSGSDENSAATPKDVQPAIATSIKIPGQLPGVGGAPAESGEPGTPVPPGTPGAVAGGPGQAGEPMGEPDPLALKFPPNMPRPKDTPQAAKKALPPLGRLIANRDYQIVVTCFADRVEVTPGGFDFDMTNRNEQEIDRELIANIRKTTDRRQATVRPGEAPYRVNIRFQVHPEGLRTYLRVYPLIEALNLPMSRENLER
ncbi:MAG: hypothetical protein K2X38_08185 [Gemmataceae bacterium]|nr:hypothetical protein [Gemmataceae bacterium]